MTFTEGYIMGACPKQQTNYLTNQTTNYLTNQTTRYLTNQTTNYLTVIHG